MASILLHKQFELMLEQLYLQGAGPGDVEELFRENFELSIFDLLREQTVEEQIQWIYEHLMGVLQCADYEKSCALDGWNNKSRKELRDNLKEIIRITSLSKLYTKKVKRCIRIKDLKRRISKLKAKLRKLEK